MQLEEKDLLKIAENIYTPKTEGPKYVYVPEISVYDPKIGLLDMKNENKKKIQVNDEIADMEFIQTIKPVDLTGDQGVLKYLIKEGVNNPDLEPITKDATANIKYEGRLKNGELVDKLRNVNETRKIKLYNDCYIKGIHIAVLSMKKGETAWFKFEPDYHYFSGGFDQQEQNIIEASNPTFKIENKPLFYKITLHEYKNPEKNLDVNDFEGRLKKLEEFKTKGNEFFRAKDYEKAKKSYESGINILKQMPKVIKEYLTPEREKILNDMTVDLNGNVAQVKLNMQSKTKNILYWSAKENLSAALKLRPNHPKNRYRMAICKRYTGELAEAINILKELVKEDETNQDVKSKLQEFLDLEKIKKQKDKQKFEKLFNSMATEEEEEIARKKLKEREEKKLLRKKEKKKEIETKLKELENLGDLEEDDFEEKTYQPTFTLEDLQNGVILDAADMNCPLNQENYEK